MARVKQEVRQQQRLQHQHQHQQHQQHQQSPTKPPLTPLDHRLHVSPMSALAAQRPPMSTMNEPPHISKPSDACIDLTLDDDSEEDDEPLSRNVHSRNDEPKQSEPQATALDVMVSDGCESDVDEALPIGDRVEVTPSADADREVTQGGGEAERMELSLLSGNDVESEEDEDLPLIAAPSSDGNPDASHESDNTASVGSEREGEKHDDTNKQPQVVTVQSLEDGEIFEEGAEIKSPNAVKAAIALELQASRAAAAEGLPVAKKKQKKRGRKKNKRKAEAAMMMVTTEDQDISSDVPPLGAEPPLGLAPPLPMTPPPPPLPPSASVGAMHPPPFVRPFGPAMMHPPPPPPFFEDHVVRVHRIGGVEAFRPHGARHTEPPLPPPMGFRYRQVNPQTGSPDVSSHQSLRGLKRPLPRSLSESSSENGYASVSTDDETSLDLDSLRAAALRTKRATSTKKTRLNDPTVASESSGTMDSSDRSPRAVTAATDKSPAEDESLEALRMAILRSRQKKKSVQTGSTSEPSPEVETTATAASGESASVAHNEEVSVDALEALSAPAATPMSPEIRPLTASTQSLVIRVSLDDMLSKQARKDSYDDAALRNPSAPVAELKRQIAAKEQELRVTRSGSVSDVKGAHQAKRAVELEQSIAAMKKAIEERERARQSSSASETSSLPSMSPGDRSLEADLDTGRPSAQRAELRREFEQCQREVQEADAHIARLDVKIAKIKAALATAAVESAA